MKNKTITALVAIIGLGVFAGVAFGGSNIRTFYNENLKDAVDSGTKKAGDMAKEAGGTIVENAKDFSSSLYDKASEKAGEGIQKFLVDPAKEALKGAVKGILSGGSSVLTKEDVKEILENNPNNTCTCQ